MAEAEREKQVLHEEKLKAVENVEKHVRSHESQNKKAISKRWQYICICLT